MALIFHGTEVDKVVYHGTELDYVYYHNQMVYEATIYVPKPTINGSFTFDNSAKSPTVTGYDSAAMTKSGTESATAAGTYSITYTLRTGYAWTDGTTSPVTLTWSIAKRTITIPSLTNTSYTWTVSTTYAPTVNNMNSSYVTQSGTASSTNAGSFTVSWALKYPASTQWSDGTTANKSGSWSVAKRSLTIPSLSNTAQTWTVNTTHKVTVNNFNSTYETQSGTTSTTSAGSNTITWALQYPTNTQWSDGTTANKTATWTVAKRSLTIPTLTGTSFAFIEGTTRSTTVNNFNSTYENQSGTTSTSALGSYTITWSLKYSANTQWSDGTTGNKTATWAINWVNGTSHYSNDLYNKGWYKSNSLEFSDRFSGNAGSITWNSDNLQILGKYMRTADWFQGKTVHFLAKAVTKSGSPSYPTTFYVYDFKTGTDWGHTTNGSFNTLNTDQYREYSGTNSSSTERHLGTQNGVSPGSSNSYATAFQRIWVT